MRKPQPNDFREDDGTIDYDAFDEKMCDYEDDQRDQELERRMERHAKKQEEQKRIDNEK